jgi:hypothetical protein
MTALKEHMGQTAAGQQQLMAMFVSLARDLKRQMEIADTETKSALGKAFEEFLREVAQDATDLDVLYWAAETYRGMGESFISGVGKSLPEQAQGYLNQAGLAYQRILDRGKKEPSFLSESMGVQVRLQLAKTKRSRLDYVGAMDLFEAILKSQSTILPVQIEAARTYQDWASLGKPELYTSAMIGGRPDKGHADPAKRGRNIVWGWLEIVNRTTGDPRCREQHQEARFNLALCRYQFAVHQKEPARRSEMLSTASRDITGTMALYGSTLGESWKTQYDTLLKNVQKAQGKEPLGLKGLESGGRSGSAPASTTATTSTSK